MKKEINKDKKLLMFDLDNTLLHSDKTISKFTQETIDRCHDLDIGIGIATARPERGVKEYLDIIKPSITICHNGGVTYYLDDLISYLQVGAEAANSIIRTVKQKYPNARIAYEIKDDLFSNFDTTVVWETSKFKKTNFDSHLVTDVDNIVIDMFENETILDLLNEIISDDLYVGIVDKRIALVMNKLASKHNAIATVIGKLNFPVSQVVSFGDDLPDIGMLRYCGIGVAVDNALDTVKDAADYICQSNDEDGVAKWINKNVLDDI